MLKRIVTIILLSSYSTIPALQASVDLVHRAPIEFERDLQWPLPPHEDSMLSVLLHDFARYRTTNTAFHAGNLIQHSLWVTATVAKYWDEASPWIREILPVYKQLTLLGALFHDIGKAGDGITSFKAKFDHPRIGFDYVLGRKQYKLVSGKTFDVHAMLLSYGFTENDIKRLAIVIGAHWFMGGIIMKNFGFTQHGVVEETKAAFGFEGHKLLEDPQYRRRRQFIYAQYIESLKILAQEASYNNGIIDKDLLLMAVLISVSDVQGMHRVDYANDTMHLLTIDELYPGTVNIWNLGGYEQYGLPIRQELLSLFV